MSAVDEAREALRGVVIDVCLNDDPDDTVYDYADRIVARFDFDALIAAVRAECNESIASVESKRSFAEAQLRLTTTQLTEAHVELAAVRGGDFVTWAQHVREEHDATHGEAEMCGAECIVMGLAEFQDVAEAKGPVVGWRWASVPFNQRVFRDDNE